VAFSTILSAGLRWLVQVSGDESCLQRTGIAGACHPDSKTFSLIHVMPLYLMYFSIQIRALDVENRGGDSDLSFRHKMRHCEERLG
jgi:hypothetical protein